ncbi:hypothetical protein SUDANB105_07854 [Streptomyces sp. enrichment culture]|uniref:hypothetical protein n=1 Tax=Streptomyces sp. enrichment culture TaxID=1795815 RepID=UPI003F566FF9
MNHVPRSSVPDETEHLARWCRLLPELENAAAVGGWLDELRAQAAIVAAGGPASEAFRALGFETGTRRDAGLPALPGLPQPKIPAGIYRCPTSRCGRLEGRADDGRVPVCRISGTRLTLKAEA